MRKKRRLGAKFNFQESYLCELIFTDFEFSHTVPSKLIHTKFSVENILMRVKHEKSMHARFEYATA